MEMKKFMDIQRMRDEWNDIFSVGDEIWIEEKIDGANCGIRYDKKNDKLVAQSRKRILEAGQDDLRGFGAFVERLNANSEWKNAMIEKVFGGSDQITLFGEWAVKHTIAYPESVYKNMYCYDMYDEYKGEYLPQETAYMRVGGCMDMGVPLRLAPVFYIGSFMNWENINEFVGKTRLDAFPTGEGIVIKNQTRLNDPDNKKPFYVKIVTEQFREVQKSNKAKKELDPTKLAADAANMELTRTIVTEARVRKILNKLVDEGILRENWDETDMPIVAKNLSKRIVEDCIKEENDTVIQIENFGKAANKVCMGIAKEIINSK
jgi:hypothetical protein